MIAKLTGKVPAKHGASIQRRRGEGKPRQDVLRWLRASKTARSQVSVEYSRVTVWSHRRCPHQGAPGDERPGPQHGLQAGAPVGPRHERLSPAEGLLCRCGWSRAPLFCSWGTGPGDRDPGRTRGPPRICFSWPSRGREWQHQASSVPGQPAGASGGQPDRGGRADRPAASATAPLSAPLALGFAGEAGRRVGGAEPAQAPGLPWSAARRAGGPSAGRLCVVHVALRGRLLPRALLGARSLRTPRTRHRHAGG